LPLRLPSGRRLDIEFHARRDGTAQRLEVAMRSLPDRDRANDLMALERSALGSMPAAVLRELFRSGIRRKLGSGERLAKSLTDDSWVLLVTAGIVRLYVAMDGYEPTLAYGNAGSLFGTHAMVPSDTVLVGLQSVTPSVVLQLSARHVEDLAKSNAAFARALSEDVQIHLREVVRSFAAHAAGNLRQRLAREITLLSDLGADDGFVSVTEQQLADGVGSIRESIGRSVGELRREAVVDGGVARNDRRTGHRGGHPGLHGVEIGAVGQRGRRAAIEAPAVRRLGRGQAGDRAVVGGLGFGGKLNDVGAAALRHGSA